MTDVYESSFVYLNARVKHCVRCKGKHFDGIIVKLLEILLFIIWKSRGQSYKLAHTQVIGWALWCLWTVISLVSAYAFFLGIATPLMCYKRISTRINLIRVDNSAIIPLRFTLHTVQTSSFVSHSQVSTARDCINIFLHFSAD